MSKYGPAAHAKMHKVMEEFEDGKLQRGRAGRIVADRTQAIAKGLSNSRRSGYKLR